MQIEALFIIRASDPNSPPELLTAWDEYSVDENTVGWEEDRRKALDALQGDYLASAIVTIEVPEEKVRDILLPTGKVAGVLSDR